MAKLAGRAVYLIAALALVVVLGAYYLLRPQSAPARVSEFGKYRGYSSATYDGTRRTSDYLTLSNGTRLAYDVILPTNDGVVAARPLPALFKYTPYLRTFTVFNTNGTNIIAPLFQMTWFERTFLRVRYWLNPASGHLMDAVFRDKWLGRMLKHGYAVVVVERPGTGASFGKLDASFEAGMRETNEVIDWIAAQKWCNGNVGMYGDSWQAQIQLSAAATANPHLKAIMPISTWLEQYNAVVYPGGVKNKAFVNFFTWAMIFLNSNVITPVDRDTDGALLARARAERGTRTVAEAIEAAINAFPFRDSTGPTGVPALWSDDFMPYAHLDRINQAGVPMYLSVGWYDIFTRDAFLLYSNLDVPKRLVVRPLDHSQITESDFDLDLAAEAQRWFDYWLKGIKNGVMDGPPIHYYLMGADKGRAWQTTDVWPVHGRKYQRYYFASGAGDRAVSMNDGALQMQPPNVRDAADTYVVDYTTTTGKKSRWAAVNWTRDYSNMRTNDAKALTFTTAPLTTTIRLVGHPVVHLWLRSAAPDLDAFAYLEAVDAEGNSTYLTEGDLRASLRALSTPPFDNLGLPYHDYFERDRIPLSPHQPVELVFDLLPTAYAFTPGARLRLTIAFADADNFDTPIIVPAPTVYVSRGSAHPSFVDLPVVEGNKNVSSADADAR
jgi:putative CocE/NonD family hydrolase